ncbi:MAG: trehalose-6-phosphate synthase, partial [Candidatus Saccharimonadales bacterium]
RSVGGLATALASVFEKGDALWIGWPGTKHPLTKKQLADIDFPERLVPISISEKLLHGYYDHLANGVLWPIMHGLTPSKEATSADWSALREVNRRFARSIQDNLQPDDIIWIHDYHLILVPQMLRNAGVKNRIGFFLHTPFPPENTLLAWSECRQLLQSLSCVDVLGFHTPRDVMNFRVNLAAMGMSMRPGAIVRAFPIGVDYKAYRAAGKVAKVKNYLQRITNKAAGKKVILSVSRLDYTKGILQQLDAVSELLEAHKHPERIFYKLIVAPSREDVEEYRRLKQDIDDTVSAINARFGKGKKGFKPIDFAYRSHGFEEVNAWFRLADILLVTPRIDGMNLVIKEYIAARETDRGMIVMSDTIGAAVQLKDAILVEPMDVTAITGGLWKALAMPMLDRRKRWQKLRKNVRQEDVYWWSSQFLDALRG